LALDDPALGALALADSAFADLTFADLAFADLTFADSTFANCIKLYHEGRSSNKQKSFQGHQKPVF
jgi:hypothetical protein